MEIVAPGIVLASSLVISAAETPIWIAYRQMRFVRQRVLESIDPVVAATVTIVLAIAGLGYWSLVLGPVAGSICGGIAAVATSPYPLRLRYERGTLREYFSFSWPLLASSASGLVIVQASVLIGNFTVGLAGLGALGLATTFSMFADRLDSLIRRTIYPAVCAVKDRTALLFEAFEKSNRLALMWAFPFGVGLALFAPDLISVRPRRALARGGGPAAGVRAHDRRPPGRLQLGDLLHARSATPARSRSRASSSSASSRWSPRR